MNRLLFGQNKMMKQKNIYNQLKELGYDCRNVQGF